MMDQAYTQWWGLIPFATVFPAHIHKQVFEGGNVVVCCLWCRELTVILSSLNTTQQLLINADSIFASWYHISQSGIRSMKGWHSAVHSCGLVGQTSSISGNIELCLHAHTHTLTYTNTNTHTPSVFNHAAKDFNEPQAFIAPPPPPPPYISQGQRALN